MSGRSGLRWFILLLLLATVALGYRTCSDRRDGADGTAATPATDERSATASTPAPADDAGNEARTRHAAALRAAVSALHAYVSALPEDLAKANASWVDGAPSPDAREADLRNLATPPRALRIQNRAPRALDAAAVPEEVEIEVELHLHLDAPPPRRYAGTYRLRRIGEGAQGDEWRITGAAIDALPPPR